MAQILSAMQKSARLRATLATILLLAASAALAENRKPANSKDGEYFDANADPTYNISPDGKVDWRTYSGYLRFSAECLRCHGPDGLGSSYAPNLTDSLKRLTYPQFLQTVAGGKRDLAGGQEKVMPSLGTDKNVMCFVDDIYVYLKARADGALPRGRPTDHEPKPKSWSDAEDACMGPE